MKHPDSTSPVDVVTDIEIAKPIDVVAAFAADPDNVSSQWRLRLKRLPTGTRIMQIHEICVDRKPAGVNRVPAITVITPLRIDAASG